MNFCVLNVQLVLCFIKLHYNINADEFNVNNSRFISLTGSTNSSVFNEQLSDFVKYSEGISAKNKNH